MGLFDDISSAIGDFGAAKDEVVDQVSQNVGDVVPEEIQNPIEGVQDTIQSLGENLPGQGGDEQ